MELSRRDFLKLSGVGSGGFLLYGILNQDKVAGPFREILISLGFPPPVSHVTGMFSFQKSTIKVLSEAGFKVDCSLIPNGKVIKHDALGDFVIADNRRRTDRRAYRPSDDDPWVAGNSNVLELPVSGDRPKAVGGAGAVLPLTPAFCRRANWPWRFRIYTTWSEIRIQRGSTAQRPKAKTAEGRSRRSTDNGYREKGWLGLKYARYHVRILPLIYSAWV